MRAPQAHPRVAAREPPAGGLPGAGPPPRAGRREARPARSPPAAPPGLPLRLPPDSPSAAAARLDRDPHPAWESCLCARRAGDCQPVRVIIAQNGTGKLRVASFLPVRPVQKNASKTCVSPSAEGESLPENAAKIS